MFIKQQKILNFFINKQKHKYTLILYFLKNKKI